MKKTAKPEKVYVKVNSDFDATGYMQPRSIIWRDGRIFPIEQVRDLRPVSSVRDGRSGYCYTVIVHGQEKSLFFERTDPRIASKFGRWFVEAAASG